MNKSVEFSAPHLRSSENELLISLDFFFAALPVIIWSVIAYGARPLGITVLSMLCASLFELVSNHILRHQERRCTRIRLILDKIQRRFQTFFPV